MRQSVVKAKEMADKGLDGKTICDFLEKDAYNVSSGELRAELLAN